MAFLQCRSGLILARRGWGLSAGFLGVPAARRGMATGPNSEDIVEGLVVNGEVIRFIIVLSLSRFRRLLEVQLSLIIMAPHSQQRLAWPAMSFPSQRPLGT